MALGDDPPTPRGKRARSQTSKREEGRAAADAHDRETRRDDPTRQRDTATRHDVRDNTTRQHTTRARRACVRATWPRTTGCHNVAHEVQRACDDAV